MQHLSKKGGHSSDVLELCFGHGGCGPFPGGRQHLWQLGERPALLARRRYGRAAVRAVCHQASEELHRNKPSQRWRGMQGVGCGASLGKGSNDGSDGGRAQGDCLREL